MDIGIIAEDDSDVAVVREITLSSLRPHRIGFKRFIGHGCGRLCRKCETWAKILVKKGCLWIIVVHDLDVKDETKLRAQLEKAIKPSKAKVSVVLIPKREIEAWLLYDSVAIAKAFNARQQLRLPGNPESLDDPKKHLHDLIWNRYHKVYINTVHNALIAKKISISLLRRSLSFSPHPIFVLEVRKMIESPSN